jgi:hypothetical protein
MKTILFAACIAASIGGAEAASRSEAAFSNDWKRLRSDNFVAVGNADYTAMRSVLAELEGFRRALLRWSPTLRPLRTAPRVPTTVVVFKDERSFSTFRPADASGRRRESVAGYFLSGPEANYLVVPMHRDRARTFQYLFHEYTHFVVHQNMDNVPLWLNEGLAEFYSTFRAIPRDRRGVLGEAPSSRLALVQQGRWLPLREVLTMERNDRALSDPERGAQFYAQAWVLVHYLAVGFYGKHPERLGTYLHTRQKGGSVDAAARAGFGKSVSDLDAEIMRYARQQRPLPTIELPEPGDGVRLRTSLEALTPDEAASFQSALLKMLQQSSKRKN